MNEALVLLALVWAAMLVPSALRSRNASPHATVGGFERAMDVLRSESGATPSRDAAGRQLLVPGDAGRIVERPVQDDAPAQRAEHAQRAERREDPVITRRRVWFLRALGVSGVTLVLAIAFGGWLWLPAGVALAATVTYVGVLRRLKLQRDEARQVVRDLELSRPSEQAVARRDAAVGDEGAPGRTWDGGGTVRLRRWDD